MKPIRRVCGEMLCSVLGAGRGRAVRDGCSLRTCASLTCSFRTFKLTSWRGEPRVHAVGAHLVERCSKVVFKRITQGGPRLRTLRSKLVDSPVVTRKLA